MEGFSGRSLSQRQLNEMARTDSAGTEKAGAIGVGGSAKGDLEMIEGEGVKESRTSVSMTIKAQQDALDALQGKPKDGESIHNHEEDDNNKPGTSVEMFHKHPREDLRASGESGDLAAWRKQYEQFGVEYQWIIGFDDDGNMYKVKYRRDGEIVKHMEGGEEVSVSKTKNGEYIGGVKEASFDELADVKALCDKQEEINDLKRSLFSSKMRATQSATI